jgi:uncharacterized protein (TIGR02246 family)
MEKELETAAIKEATQHLYTAFETLDFKAAAYYLTEDCDYITFNGQHIKGREAYIRMHENLMNNFVFRGAKLEGHIEDIRFINDTTAIVIATGAIRFRWQRQTPKNRQSINTSVWIQTSEGEWRMTSFHNSRIKKTGPFIRWMMKRGKF